MRFYTQDFDSISMKLHEVFDARRFNNQVTNHDTLEKVV